MKPCLTRSRSWTMSGRSRLSAYENDVKWNPGELLGDRGATDQVPAFDDQHLQPRLGEVGAVDEPVVSAADDDGVVVLVTMSDLSSGLTTWQTRSTSYS